MGSSLKTVRKKLPIHSLGLSTESRLRHLRTKDLFLWWLLIRSDYQLQNEHFNFCIHWFIILFFSLCALVHIFEWMIADICGVTHEPGDLELEVAVRNLMWLLRITLMFSARARSFLTLWTFSPVPHLFAPKIINYLIKNK